MTAVAATQVLPDEYTGALKLDEGPAKNAAPIVKNPRRAALRTLAVSGVGFLADAYDLFVIDFVVAILAATAFHEPTTGEKGLIASATLVGAVIGQLSFGVAADLVGRRTMFIVTAVLTIFGSIASSLVGFGYRSNLSSFNVFYQLALCRFLLGVGIGGEYPLSASVSSEQSEQEAQQHVANHKKDTCFWFLYTKPNSVACVFSMQGVGSVMSPILVIIFTKAGMHLETCWRISLGLGALPSAIAFFYRWKMHESAEYEKGRRDLSAAAEMSFSSTNASDDDLGPAAKDPSVKSPNRGGRGKSLKATLARQFDVLKDFRKALIGTSMTWLLIDVTFYGTGSFKSAVVSEWFTSDSGDSEATEEVDVPESYLANDILDGASLETARTIALASYTDIGMTDNLPKSDDFYTDLAAADVDRKYPAHRLRVAAPLSYSGPSPVEDKVIRRPLSWPKSHQAYQKEAVEAVINYFRGGAAKSTPQRRRLAAQEVDEQEVRDEILEKAVAGTVVALIAIPGYILSVFFIHRVGLKNLTHWGFWAVAAAFMLLGVIQFCGVTNKPLNLIVFGLTFLFTNFGPNSTTFILPTTVYPTVVRATCHGFSAAMGKVGGVIGTNAFGPVNEALGLGWLLTFCAIVAVLGALVSIFFLPTDGAAREKMLDSQRQMAERADRHRAAVATRKAEKFPVYPAATADDNHTTIELADANATL